MIKKENKKENKFEPHIPCTPRASHPLHHGLHPNLKNSKLKKF